MNRIVKPIVEKPTRWGFEYCCPTCELTIHHRVQKLEANKLPNFCYNCGTQLKELDPKLFELWGIEP